MCSERPKGKGSPAKLSWQTILMLRVAVLLRDQFNLELQAHKAEFADLRKLLLSQSFIALWGMRLALGSDRAWVLLDGGDAIPTTDALLITLDPHLDVLRDGFALPSQERRTAIRSVSIAERTSHTAHSSRAAPKSTSVIKMTGQAALRAERDGADGHARRSRMRRGGARSSKAL